MKIRLRSLVVGVVSVVVVAAGPAAAVRGEEGVFVDHGVMAAVSESRGMVVVRGGDGRERVVVLPMDRYAGELRTSLLVVDPGTGESRQYWYPKKEAGNDAPFCLLVAGGERLYTTFGGTFLEFDLGRREWTFAGKAGAGAAMSLAEGPGGKVYAGFYPACELFEFDPAARVLTKRVKLDAREEYPSSMVATKDGWVYVGIGTARCNLVAYRPATGEVRQLVAEEGRTTGSGVVVMGVDGIAYGRAPADGPWVRLEDGAATAVAGTPDIAKDVGGMKWQEARGALAGGGRVADFDLAARRFKVVQKDGSSCEVGFDYESSGAAVAALGVGPDGRVYGSTSHPMQLFRVDPRDGGVKNFGGIARVGGGNFPALVAARGRVVGMSYSGGDVYAFDPEQDWTGGAGAKANPVIVGQFRPHIGRPRGGLAHSDGRSVVFGGFPGYGRAGGGLFVYDMESGESAGLTAEQLLPGHSPITMDELPGGDVVVGTSVSTPGGGHGTARTAELFVLDWTARRVRFHVPVEGSREVVSVRVGADGRVYGVTREAALVVFDVGERKWVHRADLSKLGTPANAGHRTLLRGDDGRMLVVLSRAIAEVDAANFEVRVLATPPAPVSAVGAVAGGRLYYGSDSYVWSYGLPGSGSGRAVTRPAEGN